MRCLREQSGPRQSASCTRAVRAIAVLAARMVRACRDAGSPAILTAATEALWSYTIPLRRARAALLVGDVMVLGAPQSGGSAALTPGQALLPGLLVWCRGNLAGFWLSALGRGWVTQDVRCSGCRSAISMEMSAGIAEGTVLEIISADN